jgi:hypothetical protein
LTGKRLLALMGKDGISLSADISSPKMGVFAIIPIQAALVFHAQRRDLILYGSLRPLPDPVPVETRCDIPRRSLRRADEIPLLVETDFRRENDHIKQ